MMDKWEFLVIVALAEFWGPKYSQLTYFPEGDKQCIYTWWALWQRTEPLKIDEFPICLN